MTNEQEKSPNQTHHNPLEDLVVKHLMGGDISDLVSGTMEEKIAGSKARAQQLEEALQSSTERSKTYWREHGIDSDDITARSQEIGRQQSEMRQRHTKTFDNLMGKIMDSTIGPKENGSTMGGESATTQHDPVQELLGKDTSPDAKEKARAAIGAIRTAVELAGGDQELARKNLARSYHPDKNPKHIGIMQFINKAWDGEKNQFKI